MAIIQKNRLMSVSTPLADDTLLLKGMNGTETVSNLFEFELDLLSKKANIDFNKLVGDSMTIRLDMADGATRYFNGFVSKFTQTGFVGTTTRFHATLVPWLWFLTQKTDCRIFQKKTVPDIIKEIFRDHGFSDFEESLSGEYRTLEYCVQYNETDFNFVSRLMEQEGIYYYFKHENGKHTLVLSDSYSSHELIPGCEEVPFFPPDETAIRERDHISGWTVTRQVKPGAYVHTDFDFEKPKKSLEAKSMITREHPASSYEVYFYPGEYTENADGDNYAKIRLQELQSSFELSRGEGNAKGITPGGLFKLTGLPRDDRNKEYMVISAIYQLQSDAFETGDDTQGETTFHCSFTSIDSREPYRPSRITPKPFIHGHQTAIVVGKAGEEIWTDKYGRVKVQFHWDREGESNEKSSCWIRVAQIWAGNKWGGIHIPRMGQEVIIEFLEGNPDRPIITGRVYNGGRMPPYALPGNATQSGIKSRSSKGGVAANFNEIRFEDKKGEEELNIQAEKNTTILTKNDKNQTTGHDETLLIENDRTKTVNHDETTTIGNDRTESVGKNESITIGENHTESVGKDESITIGANRTESVGKNESISIGENRDLSVGKNESINVGKDETVSIGGNSARSVEKDETISITGNLAVSVEKNNSIDVTKNYSLKAKKISINADDEIQIVTGSAKIIMKKNGNIRIAGKDINIKASGNIKMKGSKIAEN